jgi:surface protein
MAWCTYNNKLLLSPNGNPFVKMPPLGSYTFRFQFSDSSFNPSAIHLGYLDNVQSYSWSKVFDGVWDIKIVPKSNYLNRWTEDLFAGSFNGLGSINVKLIASPSETSLSNNFASMFADCSNLVSVSSIDVSNGDLGYMFSRCRNLKNVYLTTNNGSAINTECMFLECFWLETVSLFNTSENLYMGEMFYGCIHLKSIPLFDTSSVETMKEAFRGCRSVESGALALYQQASSQSIPPSNHQNTFLYCGSNTVTGAAELAQIPQSWGGTANG